MSVTACQYARVVDDCGTCGRTIETVVEHPEGKEGVHVRGVCGHYNWLTNFEPLGGVADV